MSSHRSARSTVLFPIADVRTTTSPYVLRHVPWVRPVINPVVTPELYPTHHVGFSGVLFHTLPPTPKQ